ncbi:hypothetical protein MATL_G00167670 [Megalops atlanticus]|uniref:Uncharacterized protein n=1 Tax=Megalops atlanticus TaxID=7932 RepID=A0A9D3PP10_MEGAT|nr:hypothetical protein MATL_G00167670 [Megalops atlanticus]
MDPVRNSFFVSASSGLGYIKILISLLHIAMIALGALHLHDCPKQPYIPIYLIVGGVFWLLVNILSFSGCSQAGEGVLGALCTACNFLLYLFLFCWFITGSVWVYTIFPPNYESPSKEDYCEKTLYLFTFWFHNACYVTATLGMISWCCSSLYTILGGT